MRVLISVLMVVWASVAVAQGECHADVPCVLESMGGLIT